jgi:hypothetical protein
MRHITALTPEKVPRDAEFNFKLRANALVDRWHQILNANKPNGAASDGGANGAAQVDGEGPAVNGKSPAAGANAMQVDQPAAADVAMPAA